MLTKRRLGWFKFISTIETVYLILRHGFPGAERIAKREMEEALKELSQIKDK